MTVQTIPVGDYQANCYVLSTEDSKECILIDPGDEAEKIKAILKENGLTPVAILLTHGHFDHVGGVRDFDLPVYLHEAETALPESFTAGALRFTNTYGEGDILTLAGLPMKILHTPGHTPGSVCIAIGNTLFTGDTLFAGSCGRTDFPLGSPQKMRASLARLAKLDGRFRIFPGHGPESTIEIERLTNPYLKESHS